MTTSSANYFMGRPSPNGAGDGDADAPEASALLATEVFTAAGAGAPPCPDAGTASDQTAAQARDPCCPQAAAMRGRQRGCSMANGVVTSGDRRRLSQIVRLRSPLSDRVRYRWRRRRGRRVASRLPRLANKPPALWTCPWNRDCRSSPGTVGASRRVGLHGRADRGGTLMSISVLRRPGRRCAR